MGATNPEIQAARQDFYERIATGSCTPLWEVLGVIVPESPPALCKPYLWKWKTVWPWIQQAGELITAKQAERRVLVLENPGLPGKSRITQSLYAGLQLILPGEVAPTHRHSQSALRFVMHGSGAYTAVDGQKVKMNVGDFVITPQFMWHDHGNTSNEPMVWLDGLDLPIVEMFNAQYFEKYEADTQKVNRSERLNLAMFGNAMKPVEYTRKSKTSPLFWYPYERTLEALHVLRHAQDAHPSWGYKLQYVNPVTGGWPMPSIGTFMQLLPAGFKGKAYQATDSTVFSVVEGSGKCTVGGVTLEFNAKDVFVCPSWMPYSFEALTECVLFSYSDRPAQQALDLWREADSQI